MSDLLLEERDTPPSPPVLDCNWSCSVDRVQLCDVCV